MEPRVDVEQGALEGVPLPGGVLAFKGVPYARPPVGELRWRAPQPPEPWEGVRKADAFGPDCTQPRMEGDYITPGEYMTTSEDCLYLNVWTGAEHPDERRPVMVWFHFGGFQVGGGSASAFDGAALARAGVVLVTPNHRLGRLGFLAHPELSAESEHGVSGNYGLLDEICALRWVHENIDAFGGDPGCVTIFGLSAGSMSVSALMGSPLARGLFHRALGESGALFGPVAGSSGMTDCLQDLGRAEQTGVLVAEALGARSIDDLRARSPQELLQAPLPGYGPEWTSFGFPFRRGQLDSGFPIADGYVLPSSPFEIFGEGGQADVPLLTGSVAAESSGMPYLERAADFVADSRAEYGALAEEFLRLFPADSDEQARAASAASNGDRVFVWQNWTWARAHSRTAQSRTFYYHFSHVPPAPPGSVPAGAVHGAEIPYVFRRLDDYDWAWSRHDRELAETISSYWINFAREGDPNGAGLPDWPAFDAEAPEAMHFGEAIAAGPVPRRRHLDFWDEYFEGRRAER